MSTADPVHEQAEQLFRRARRTDRLWPAALVALLLYLGSSCWAFPRPLGETGSTALIRALPTIWPPLVLAGIVVAGRLLARHAELGGDSPFWWPRQLRRVLIGLAVVLPVLCFAVSPLLAVMAVDTGSVEPGTLGSWLLDVRVTVL